MKKIFLPLLLLLSVFSIETKAQIEKPIKIRITINVNIASKRSGCESGFGFCEPTGSVSFRTVKTGIYTEGNTINLCLKRSDLNDQLSDELSAISIFPVEDGFELSEEVSEKLGYNEPVRIKKGNYRILVTDEFYVIACEREIK